MSISTPITQPVSFFQSTELKYSEGVPEFLQELQCSLALSSYQSNKVILLASDGKKIYINDGSFNHVKGISFKNGQLIVACATETIVLGNDPEQTPIFPKQALPFDAMFLPRITYHTGPLSLHDITVCDGEIIGVNTNFNCLCKPSHKHSFEPIWKPAFISDMINEDRCHLNGLATVDGKPKYVTALSQSDEKNGWRSNMLDDGIVMDVESNRIILENLAMPHSPQVINDELYVLLSATGELIKVDPQNNDYEVITTHPGFVRGMTCIDDYLFIGLSTCKQGSPLAELETAPDAIHNDLCGFDVVHLPSRKIIHRLAFLNQHEQIYDICLLPGIKRAAIIGTVNQSHQPMISTPGKDKKNITPNNLPAPSGIHLDKAKLIGSCKQLPIQVDVEEIHQEILSIPANLWGEFRAEAHRDVDAVFLKGYAPYRELPDEERPILAKLSAIKKLIYETIPGHVGKCLVANLKPKGIIPVHVDGDAKGSINHDYFHSTVRLHIPITTNEQVRFYINGQFYNLSSGHVWAIDNIAEHGVYNDNINLDRYHIIVDMYPDQQLLNLLSTTKEAEGYEHEEAFGKITSE